MVEGSVGKRCRRVRISAQLIGEAPPAVTSEPRAYDRDLTDVFAVQDEITRTVVEQLKVKLLPEEKKAIERVATKNIEAYTVYLRGASFPHCGLVVYRSARQMFARRRSRSTPLRRAMPSLTICEIQALFKIRREDLG